MKSSRIAATAGFLGAVAVVAVVMIADDHGNNERVTDNSDQNVQQQGSEGNAGIVKLQNEKSESSNESLEKLWAPVRESGLITKIKSGSCWAGLYNFRNPKTVELSNDDWETLIKIFCFLQGEEYMCEQLGALTSPMPKDSFVALINEESTRKFLGDDLIKAIRYDLEHDIEYHGVTLSKLPSLILAEKKFDIVEHENQECDEQD